MTKFSFIHRFPVLCLVLMFIGAVMLATMPACGTSSTYEDSYKMLTASKLTLETLGKTAKELHRTGILNANQIAQAEEAYGALDAVQREFTTMQAEAILTNDATMQAQAASLGITYLNAASRFISLAIQYGVIKGDDPRITTVPPPPTG